MPRTLVQISDLHFGAILQPTLEPLVRALDGIAPDLTIVSGDLTQRARDEQFREAAAYLRRLPGPQLIVPGNHDVPLYDVVRRFAAPLGRYRRHVTHDTAPAFIDEEVAVVGINTARSLVFKGGRISTAQVAQALAQFDRARNGQARILVTHHPFDVPEGLAGVSAVGGGDAALEAFARAGVDLALAGHIHLVHWSDAAARVPGAALPLAIAGTAVSTRARRESNSFFVIRIDEAALHVETRRWIPERQEFAMGETRVLPRAGAASSSPVSAK